MTDIVDEIEAELMEFDRDIEEATRDGWLHVVKATTEARHKRELRQARWRGFKAGLMLQPPRRRKETAEQRVLRAFKSLREDVEVARELHRAR